MAKRQQVALNELGGMLNRVGKQFPKLYQKVNVEHKSLLSRVRDDITALKLEREMLDAMLTTNHGIAS